VVVVDAIICNIKILVDVINLSTLSSRCRRASGGCSSCVVRCLLVGCWLACCWLASYLQLPSQFARSLVRFAFFRTQVEEQRESESQT